jgi:hypothetical protein
MKLSANAYNLTHQMSRESVNLTSYMATATLIHGAKSLIIALPHLSDGLDRDTFKPGNAASDASLLWHAELAIVDFGVDKRTIPAE